jgi:hypothetical protein
MVFIHGGGFTSGSSALPSYNPEALVSSGNIVFVSLQYRCITNDLYFYSFSNDVVVGSGVLQSKIFFFNPQGYLLLEIFSIAVFLTHDRMIGYI